MRKLLEHVEISIKQLSETRWSARHDTVHAITSQLDGLIEALEELCKKNREGEEENIKTWGDAARVLHCIMCFPFLVLLTFWDDVGLQQSINHVQQCVHNPTMNFRAAAMDMSAMKMLMDEKKDKWTN